jgi:hypothetical protein
MFLPYSHSLSLLRIDDSSCAGSSTTSKRLGLTEDWRHPSLVLSVSRLVGFWFISLIITSVCC